MAMDLLDPCFERHFRTERTNEEEGNRCVCGYFACSENSIIGFLCIVNYTYIFMTH
jgi:hypothetical protein